MPKSSKFEWVITEKHVLLVGGTLVCQCKLTDGKTVCNKTFPPTHKQNASNHVVRKHAKTAPVPTQTMSQSKLKFHVLPKLTPSELWALAWAESGHSYLSIENRHLRELCQYVPGFPADRKALSALVLELADRLRGLAMTQSKIVTLCYDAGTVHKQYLVVVAADDVGEYVVACVHSLSYPDKRMTAANIQQTLQTVTEQLRTFNVLVIAHVADNAANMQAASDRVSRCAAHCINLIYEKAFDTVPELSEALPIMSDAEKELVENRKQKIVSCPATRWGFQYLRICSLIKKADLASVGNPLVTAAQKVKLETAAAILKPLFLAGMQIQCVDATIFTSLAIWESLLLNVHDHVRALVLERFTRMLTEVYAIAAYFGPGVDHTQTAATIEPHIKAFLVGVDPRCGPEFDEFTDTIRTLRKVTVDHDGYFRNLGTLLGPHKTLLKVVRSLVMSKPTEANVERVFSRLKRSVPSLRNQLSEESAEALITAASCYQYLEDCASSVAVASPSKSARTEASTVASEPVEVEEEEEEGSPLPATPVGRVILDSDDEALLQDPVRLVDPFQEEQRRLAAEAARARMAAEEVDDDEAASLSTDHLQLVLQIVAARLSGSAPPVPVQNASLDRRTATRSAVDLCVVCSRPCMQHDDKAYLECRGCRRRASVSHPQLAVPKHKYAGEWDAIARRHARLESNGKPLSYLCDDCVQSGKQ